MVISHFEMVFCAVQVIVKITLDVFQPNSIPLDKVCGGIGMIIRLRIKVKDGSVHSVGTQVA